MVTSRGPLGFSKNDRLAGLPSEYDVNRFWVFVIRHAILGVSGNVPTSLSRLTGLNLFFSLDSI